jgi:hypothetical protein
MLLCGTSNRYAAVAKQLRATRREMNVRPPLLVHGETRLVAVAADREGDPRAGRRDAS